MLFRVPFATPAQGSDLSRPQAAASPDDRIPLLRLPSPEGGSNGGNRRAVSPLAVGEGFQRGPPRKRSPLAAFFLRFLAPLERNRTAGGKETNSIREIHGAYASRRCAAVKSATTKAPLWRFLFPLSFRKRNRAAGGVVGANLTGCASAVAVRAANACVRSIAPPLQIEASASI